jgi:DDE domain
LHGARQALGRGFARFIATEGTQFGLHSPQRRPTRNDFSLSPRHPLLFARAYWPERVKMVVSIAGRQMYMWRAVDSEGEVLEILVQPQRDKTAALRADEPVNGEPVCEANSLLTGKITGNSSILGHFPSQKLFAIQEVMNEFLRSRTGN